MLLKTARLLSVPALLASAAIVAGPFSTPVRTEEPQAKEKSHAEEKPRAEELKAAGGKRYQREDILKAIYLCNFGRYIQWPEKSATMPRPPFVVGVLGPDPVADILDEIAKDKKIVGRPIQVKRFATMADYTPCQVMFICSDVAVAEKTAAIEKFKNSTVLLVGEEPQFARRGANINLATDENHVRIEINLEISKQAGLKISSKLLSVAEIVTGLRD